MGSEGYRRATGGVNGCWLNGRCRGSHARRARSAVQRLTSMALNRSRVSGVLQLLLPTLNFCLRAKMLGAGFVAAFHPDPRERRVDEQIRRLQRMRAFGGRQGGVEAAQRKINL